jgi:hypothetical protein
LASKHAGLQPGRSASKHAGLQPGRSVDTAVASALQLVLLEPGARASTTSLKYIFQIDLGSHVSALERLLPNARVEAIRRHRQLVGSFQQYFANEVQAWFNDVEDDGTWREAMVDQIRHACHACTDEESTLIAQGTAQLDAFAKGKGRVRSYPHSKTVNVARIKHDKTSGRHIGEAACLVHGASPEDIVAYLMHFDSNIRKSLLKRDVVYHQMLEVKSSRHVVAFSEVAVTLGSRSRIFLNAMLWERVSDSPLAYVWVAVPIADHPNTPSKHDAVRAEVTTCCRITQMPGGRTQIEYTLSADSRGHVPELMRMPYDMQCYFIQLKPPSECTAEDGVLLGHLLMDLLETKKGPARATAIRMFVERTAALCECGFAHLDAFLCGVFVGSIVFQLGLGLQKFKTVSVPEVAAVDPRAMTAAAAASIGHGFESTMRISATPTDAIDDLLPKYPALRVMVQRHVWFRPLLETLAKRRVASSPLGLKLRLGIGAAFSIGDMASDMSNINSMLRAGHNLGAFFMLGLIALNLAFQALIVIVQTAHRGWRVVLWELFTVLSLLKPAIDAIRVAGGEERIEGAPIEPLHEMVCCKVCELTFESIPGGLVQVIFVLNASHWTAAAAVSIGLSCLSTEFTATMLDYDTDMNAERRKRNPEFYGYIPDNASERVLAFVLLLLYHSVWSLGKTFSMAVLAQTNWLWLVAYLLADHGGLILYKLARGDLIYWVPGLGVPLSLLARFVVKVVTDFSGMVQFRHPLELGGIYFFVNSLMNVASWFVAAAVYSRYFHAVPTEPCLEADMNTSLPCYLVNSSVANFVGTIIPSECLHREQRNQRCRNAIGTDAHVGKIDDFALFVTVSTLAVA